MSAAEALAAFVPRWVLTLDASVHAADHLWSERFYGVVGIADVSGFTALGEQLARRGPDGAEELWRQVDGLFSLLNEVIATHGGDVLRYAGDAPVILWRADSPGECAHRAAACGLALQAAVANYQGPAGSRFGLRIGLAAGDMVAARLGGVDGCWEHFVAGPALDAVSGALSAARRRDVVVGAELRTLLGGRAAFEQLDGALYRVTSCPPIDGPIAEAAAPGDGLEARIRQYVPPGVLARIDAGLGQWMGELRQITVMFVSLEGADCSTDAGLSRLNEACAALQRAVFDVEGQVNQFLADDKGTVLVAAWGVPGCAHEDDPTRAVQAARVIRERIGALGLSVGIGITTGGAFCGQRGGRRRLEYGLLGSVVNLAARLMAHERGGMLCDATTAASARPRFALQEQRPIKVKGRADPVAVFGTPGEADPEDQRTIGRARELAIIVRAFREPGAQRTLVLVDADAGLGKSLMVDEACRLLGSAGRRVLRGGADAIEARTPLFAFRGVLAGVLCLGVDRTPSEREAEAAA